VAEIRSYPFVRHPVRERILQEVDEAAFARRAMAVEKERAIQENELKNRIELARRQELLIAQEGQNERRKATERTEKERIAVYEPLAPQIVLALAAQQLAG